VVDDMGVDVGLLISMDGPCIFQVYDESLAWIFAIELEDTTPRSTTVNEVAFESNDCSGQAYSPFWHTTGTLLYHYGSDKHFVSTSYATNRELYSRLNGVSGCELAVNVWAKANAIQDVTSLVPTFTPPHHVELR
jgi:hypothetical protein